MRPLLVDILALESAPSQRCVGVALECGGTRTLAAQREGKRQVIDRKRIMGMIRLTDTAMKQRQRSSALLFVAST